MAELTLADNAPSRLITFRGHNDVELVGDAWGDPADPPVILLPGGGQTRHAWGVTAERLAADRWYALSLDSRGHGESGWAVDGDYSMDAFIADLRAVCAHLPHRPVVVGASLGGMTGLLTEGESPERVLAALVLVDVAPQMELDGVARIVGFMRAHLEGFESLEAAADAISEYLPHRKRPSDLSGLTKNLRIGDDGRYRWHWDPEFALGMRVPSGAQEGPRLLAAARRLTLPVMLVRGRMSEVLSEAGAAAFLQAVPHALYADVSGAGHMVAGDRNDIFADAVIEFLRMVHDRV